MHHLDSTPLKRAALISILCLFTACSDEQANTASTDHTVSATIEDGRVTLTVNKLQDTTRFDKPACELSFNVANGLDQDVFLAVDNYERMAHQPVQTGGFGAIYAGANSHGQYPLEVPGNCEQNFSYKIRSIKCKLGDRDTGDDCLDKVDISADGVVVLIDSTFR